MVHIKMSERASNIKVKFIAPTGARKNSRKRHTPNQAGIEPRLEHLYPFKALIEKLFGRAAFMKIKMGGSMRDWRDASNKLLEAINLSVKSTVKIVDEDWLREFDNTISHGRDLLRIANTIDDLLSSLVETLAEIVFIQLGNFPLHRTSYTTPLTPKLWTLTSFRTVQYVQTEDQKKAQRRLNEIRAESARLAAAER
jgi:hypothetical protein